MPRPKNPESYWNRLDRATAGNAKAKHDHAAALERQAPLSADLPAILPSDLETVPDLDVLVITEKGEHNRLLMRSPGDPAGVTHTRGEAAEDWPERGGPLMDPIRAELADRARVLPGRRRITADDL